MSEVIWLGCCAAVVEQVENSDITEDDTVNVSESHLNSHNNTSVTQQVKWFCCLFSTGIFVCLD